MPLIVAWPTLRMIESVKVPQAGPFAGLAAGLEQNWRMSGVWMSL